MIASPKPLPVRWRRGLTLVELLVVVALIGLLVALLMPAVAAAREAARRARCLSNIHQLGVALGQYQDRQGCYPPGRTACYDPRFSAPGTPVQCHNTFIDKSLLVAILADVEQAALFNAFNHDLSVFSTENTTCHRVVVGVFACPSDPTAGVVRPAFPTALANFGVDAPPDKPNQVAITSYAGVMGSLVVPAVPSGFNACQPNPIAIEQNDGVFCDVAPIAPSAIGDGLSNTAFLTERAMLPLQGIDQPSRAPPFEDSGWYFNGNWGMTLASSMYPINAYRTISRGATRALTESASSLHPGGVNLLMGDGSARFVRETVDTWPFDRNGNPAGLRSGRELYYKDVPRPGVWQALTTRAGGEVVAADQL